MYLKKGLDYYSVKWGIFQQRIEIKKNIIYWQPKNSWHLDLSLTQVEGKGPRGE
jgi:hypothetical protein